MKRDDETAIEYLRRVVNNLGYETEGILSQLPTPQAVLDYFELWEAYDTDCWSGILNAIFDGASPERARDFIRKYDLGASWLEDVNEAYQGRANCA